MKNKGSRFVDCLDASNDGHTKDFFSTKEKFGMILGERVQNMKKQTCNCERCVHFKAFVEVSYWNAPPQ